ncbi:hypothetical protein [Paludibacterium paludis]|uniref:3-keto-disaccharide hydrolase domain-containing protein n=1 Tax=Paludibacterium paludis TaxID=1225769 RepID=A0A918P0Q6_9NEIS|nr:hypothetical protein [Paludibacterium paludis]GGY11873.1 hypothetical protein GCM10011289_13470 [Paludibacterium paludis]
MTALLAIAAGALLAGCASYSDSRPDNFASLWKIERGQWRVLEDGTITGSCLTGKTRASSCSGTEMAALRGRVTLPADYRVQATITVNRGVLGELMLSWHDTLFTRVVLYSIDHTLSTGRGWMKLPEVDKGRPMHAVAAINMKEGTPFHLDATVCNKQVTVWVDGKPMLRNTDESLGYGTLGLRANGEVDFRNLKVTPLDDIACPKGYAGKEFIKDQEGAPRRALWPF